MNDCEKMLLEICRVLDTNGEKLGKKDKLRKAARLVNWKASGMTEIEFWKWFNNAK